MLPDPMVTLMLTIIASKAGAEQHSAWFHNLRANPDVTFGGIPMRATVISDQAECDRIWALADRVFAPYATYRREAAKVNRTIPIVQLTPELAVAFWDQEEGCDRRGFVGRLSRRRHEERALSPARGRESLHENKRHRSMRLWRQQPANTSG
jgi:deazaflavin-dependent oxidoreductase (nitroreductase family)